MAPGNESKRDVDEKQLLVARCFFFGARSGNFNH